MRDVDELLARAQVRLAFVIAIGFLLATAALLAFLFVPVQAAAVLVTLLTGVLAQLGTILTLQMNFFYARHRQLSSVDPSPADPMPAPIPDPTQPPPAAKP